MQCSIQKITSLALVRKLFHIDYLYKINSFYLIIYFSVFKGDIKFEIIKENLLFKTETRNTILIYEYILIKFKLIIFVNKIKYMQLH